MNENPTARTGLGVAVAGVGGGGPRRGSRSGRVLGHAVGPGGGCQLRVADAFLTAVAAQPDSACALLAPGTRQEVEDTAGSCAEGLDEVDAAGAGRVADVEVYGLDAIVRLENDTVFLAFFDNGWLVTAAGCTPEAPERPFTCDVKGG